jgi:phosphatidylglycerol:prolipoprotein diacylglycerol transferase
MWALAPPERRERAGASGSGDGVRQVLAAIPYETFPEISLGPLTIRTFGLMVALGIVLGASLAGRYVERYGVVRDRVLSFATRMVVVGLIGARLTWVVTHWSEIDSPVDVIAVWEGGLQFSGGFVAALAYAWPALRAWHPLDRWRLLDGLALGLTVGLALGRVGCYSVGEHLGGPTEFALATRYEGGDTREGPLVIGQVVHNTSLYEFLHLAVLAALLGWLLVRRRPTPGVALGVFTLWYGVARFLTDFLRVFDDTAMGLTGAQWLCLALVPAGLWLLLRAPARAEVLAAAQAERDAEEATAYEDEAAERGPADGEPAGSDL